MNELYLNAKQQYQGIVNYCRERGWTAMTNEDQCMVSIHFKQDDMTEEVSVKVHEDRKIVVINTMLPALCRSENLDALRSHLQELNEKEANSYGYFQLDGRRIVYVYAYTFDGETRFNEKAFHKYMDACIMVPYQKAERIIDLATEHLNIPAPDMSWMDWDEEIRPLADMVPGRIPKDW